MPFTRAELDQQNATDKEIDDAFARLKETFPQRYPNLDRDKIRKKLKHTLRVWTWAAPVTNAIEIVAFFFLRRKGKDKPAYTMTVGVNEKRVSKKELHEALVDVCKEMKNGSPSLLHVVNQRDIEKPGEDPLNDTKHSELVKQVFDDALQPASKQLDRKGQMQQVESPWPSDLFYWEIVNLNRES